MALAGLGFGVYVAVDLALVADVLPDGSSTAKDLGVFNMAGALPFSVAPALAPFVLSLGGWQLRRALRRRRRLRVAGGPGHPSGQARAMQPSPDRCDRTNDLSKALSMTSGWLVNIAIAEWAIRRPATRRARRRAGQVVGSS